MERAFIQYSRIEPNTGQIAGLPENPRTWTPEDIEKLKESIKETPTLLEARGLIVKGIGAKYVVIGGNMRYHALGELGYDTVPCIVLPNDMPIEKLREIAIKDNGAFGQWDWSLLMLNWDSRDLRKWNITEFEWGQGLEDTLPDELTGLDLMPDSLENIAGEDSVARERITIKYDESTASILCDLFGVPNLTSRVLWRLEDILKLKEEQHGNEIDSDQGNSAE